MSSSRFRIACLLLSAGVTASIAATPPSPAGAPSPLIDAVRRRDQKSIKALLGSKADVNAAQPDGATALSWAAHLDDLETAKSLIAAGAKVNVADEYGETPLTLACLTGDSDLVKELLAAGADPNAARWDGASALMIAAGAGNLDSVKMLVERGAKVNVAESSKGQTPLMWAAAEGHSDIVEFLTTHGADVKAVSKSGFNALVFAATKNDARSVQSILKAGADPNYSLPDGTKPLLVAAAYKSTQSAAALLDGGADPRVADKGGLTPLHTAAQLGAADLAKKLLEKGADVNARSAKAGPTRRGGFNFAPAGEQTPLLFAARANQVEVMKVLLAGKADPSIKAQDGTTLLMAAAASGHVEPVELAFTLDPDVKAVTSGGNTVMHSAVTFTLTNSTQEEVCKVVKFLASKGAPLDEKNGQGRTPMDVANILPIDKAVTLLEELIAASGATPKSPAKR